MTDTIETPTKATRPRATKATTEPPAEPELPRDIGTIIPLIREELGAIRKDQVTKVGTQYNYRGHDDIINAIVPLLNKYGVYTTVEDELLRYEGRPAANNKWNTAAVIRKAVIFWAPDGSSRISTIVAESTDNGNKSVSQAQTYAERFAYTQTFTIPTGDPDPDENAEDAPGAPEPVVQPQTTQAQADPAALTAVREDIKRLFAERGVTAKDDVLTRGSKFFNGRENWFTDAPLVPLTKLRDALAAGEVVGDE